MLFSTTQLDEMTQNWLHGEFATMTANKRID